MIKNKKIAITGHSSGIGKACYALLQDTNVIHGFSRRNGYDLTEKDKYAEAMETINQCDIVINNAYSHEYRYLQTDILNDFLDSNMYDSSKIIINLGSMSKYVNKSVNGYNRYASSKVLLDDTVDRAKLSGHSCGLVVVSPNWVDTDLFQTFKKNNPADAEKVNPLLPGEIASIIQDAIELFYYRGINVYDYEVKKLKLRQPLINL